MDDAMDLKIRIPSDRRCKMTIIFRRKPEMPLALRRISRLGHGTEQKPAHQLLAGSPFDRLLEALDLFRSHRRLHTVCPKSLTPHEA